MILYGGGGHALVVYDAYLAANDGQICVGYFDDNVAHQTRLPIPYLGKYEPELFKKNPIVIAIGNNSVREKIVNQVKHDFVNVLHPSAMIQNARLGIGTVILPRVIVHSCVEIGNHVILNSGCIIEHECKIDDFVHIAPGAILCGNVSVGKKTLIGPGAIVEKGLTIGQNSIVAAGSVITKDVPSNVVVMGIPGKIVRKNQE